jgi:hypothetical protein
LFGHHQLREDDIQAPITFNGTGGVTVGLNRAQYQPLLASP